MGERLKRGLAFIKHSSNKIQAEYPAATSRMLHLAGASSTVNLLLGLGKLLFGALSLSAFVCASGLYTLGMVLTRYCALTGVVRGKDASTQHHYYRCSGVMLVFTSLAYMVYSGWLYFHAKEVAYHEYIAMAIATFTFAEIGLNIRGVVLYRTDKSLLLHAIKTINLAASLISLVLTQSALLSFAEEGGHDPAVNALLGLVMGGCAALLGIYMIWRVGRIKQLTQGSERA